MISQNWEVFKEPKGLLKLIQLLFVIISFSCICSFSGTANYIATTNETIAIPISYPFNLSGINLKTLPASYPTIKYVSNSQFAVFVGVFSFFYCVAALLFYVFMNDFLYQDPKIRKADFIIEAVLAFLWFIAAIAWTDVTVKLKNYLETEFCMGMKLMNITCSYTGSMSFGTAYIAIIVGFTSFGLMLSGLWFLWKETSWFSKPVSAPYVQDNTAQPDGDQAYY